MFNRVRRQQLKKEFEENLLESMNSLYNLGYRLTNNREAASDLVQDASLRAFRFYYQFEKGTNFKGWILTILRNTFINQYRKKVKEPAKVSYHAVEGFVEMPQISGFAEEVFGENLQKSVGDLPEELRTAVILFYVEELSYKEIAKVMKCPIGTVMSRLYMAKQMLKMKLTQLSQNGVN